MSDNHEITCAELIVAYYMYVCRYRWIVYINPNYFGLSSVAFLVLSDLKTDCTGSQLECYISSGSYTLNQFFFDEINPYLHLVVSDCKAGYCGDKWVIQHS